MTPLQGAWAGLAFYFLRTYSRTINRGGSAVTLEIGVLAAP